MELALRHRQVGGWPPHSIQGRGLRGVGMCEQDRRHLGDAEPGQAAGKVRGTRVDAQGPPLVVGDDAGVHSGDGHVHVPGQADHARHRRPPHADGVGFVPVRRGPAVTERAASTRVRRTAGSGRAAGTVRRRAGGTGGHLPAGAFRRDAAPGRARPPTISGRFADPAQRGCQGARPCSPDIRCRIRGGWTADGAIQSTWTPWAGISGQVPGARDDSGLGGLRPRTVAPAGRPPPRSGPPRHPRAREGRR